MAISHYNINQTNPKCNQTFPRKLHYNNLHVNIFSELQYSMTGDKGCFLYHASWERELACSQSAIYKIENRSIPNLEIIGSPKAEKMTH
jgi:hypothetical protein